MIKMPHTKICKFKILLRMFCRYIHQVFNFLRWNENAYLLTDKSLNKCQCNASWFYWIVHCGALVDTSLVRKSQAGFVKSESMSFYLVKNSSLSILNFLFELFYFCSPTKNTLNSLCHQGIEVQILNSLASLYLHSIYLP